MSKMISNCYRAILAQVNYLDSIYYHKQHLKELYEELSILAFYIMEDDHKSILRSIDELLDINEELQEDNSLHKREIEYICGEIKTHLNYLTLVYRQCS